VTSTVRRSDGVHVRVLAERPPRGAEAVPPTLEDAYMFCLTNHRAGNSSRFPAGAAV
jgi:ABC-2 type transport system ATP-binding protein